MKKLFRSSLIIFIFFVFIFSFSSTAQIRKLETKSVPILTPVYIKGFVRADLNYNINRRDLYVKLDTVSLKRGSPYKITAVLLNGNNIPYSTQYGYYRNIKNFNCRVGQILEIKVGLAKKWPPRQSTKFVTVARKRVKNLISEYIFPSHNQVIFLSSYGKHINFKWKFAGFVEATALQIQKVGSGPPVFGKVVFKESYPVPANIFKPNGMYNIHQGGSQVAPRKFLLTSAATSNSQINFRYGCALHFTTK